MGDLLAVFSLGKIREDLRLGGPKTPNGFVLRDYAGSRLNDLSP